MSLAAAALAVFLLNIPFGYWRENVKKFSLQWALAIHTPVPFVILIRIMSDIGFEFITYPVLAGAFFIGQYTGAAVYNRMKNDSEFEISSCMIIDLRRKYFGAK